MEDLNKRIRRRRREGEAGFTLIELLVVIAILSVLAAIVVFNVTGVKNQGQKAACQTDAQSVQTAVDAWDNDNSTGATASTIAAGTYTATSTAFWNDLVPTYLQSIPTSCASYTVSSAQLVSGTP